MIAIIIPILIFVYGHLWDKRQKKKGELELDRKKKEAEFKKKYKHDLFAPVHDKYKDKARDRLSRYKDRFHHSNDHDRVRHVDSFLERLEDRALTSLMLAWIEYEFFSSIEEHDYTSTFDHDFDNCEGEFGGGGASGDWNDNS